jgi:hypothetical protein
VSESLHIRNLLLFVFFFQLNYLYPSGSDEKELVLPINYQPEEIYLSEKILDLVTSNFLEDRENKIISHKKASIPVDYDSELLLMEKQGQAELVHLKLNWNLVPKNQKLTLCQLFGDCSQLVCEINVASNSLIFVDGKPYKLSDDSYFKILLAHLPKYYPVSFILVDENEILISSTTKVYQGTLPASSEEQELSVVCIDPLIDSYLVKGCGFPKNTKLTLSSTNDKESFSVEIKTTETGSFLLDLLAGVAEKEEGLVMVKIQQDLTTLKEISFTWGVGNLPLESQKKEYLSLNKKLIPEKLKQENSLSI